MEGTPSFTDSSQVQIECVFMKLKFLMVISSMGRDINEIWALLVIYAAQNDGFVAPFPDNPFSKVMQSKKNSFCMPETSEQNCHSKLRKVPNERTNLNFLHFL